MSSPKHLIVVERGDKTAHVKATCAGKGCPLCASNTTERARIAFVAASA